MMHESARQRWMTRRRGEIGTIDKGFAPFKAGLVYPNEYFFGMSNLGFQTLYQVLQNDPHTSCQRVFLPEKDVIGHFSPGALRTFEDGLTGAELDLIAFSISYQNDCLHVIPLLYLLGIPPLSRDRNESHPIVLGGGPALTINPEPVAPLFDAIVIGEGEEVIEDILRIVQSGEAKSDQLEALAGLEGVYVPALYANPFDAGLAAPKANGGFGLISGHANGVPQDFNFIRRRVVMDPGRGLAQSVILTPDTEFGDLFLIEAQRGCQWGCRFCAAGFMYRHPRYDPLETLKRRIDHGLKYRNKIGLIAGDLLGHEAIHEILRYIDEAGGGFSPSSVRLNAFTPEIIHYLRKSGNRTIAIAPEAGSERLRRGLNKSFTQEEVVASAVQLAEGGIHHIKLYIMVGLPTETEEDIEELCELTLQTRQALSGYAKKTGIMPTLTLSVSPFVPKPSTPLAYTPFAGLDDIKKKVGIIRKRLLPHGHIRLAGESGWDAYVETLLSRGDRRVVEFLQGALVMEGKARVVGTPAQQKKAMRQLSFDPQAFITRPMDPDGPAPWDFIDHGMKKSYYSRELAKYGQGKFTHYCMPEVCRSCGVC